ncbi:MAG: SDR family oxidoreductase [Desulfobacterales bacterium]|nr:SDR family oxidoreductase [Desulfobacterales bacterium]
MFPCKALVTGGAGFIGSHLVDALLEKRCDVTVLDNLSSGRLSNIEHVKDRIVFCQGDIRDPDILLKTVKDCSLIFHLAAVVSVPQTVEDPMDSALVNEIGTLQVLETARRSGVQQVVLSSSCAVYGDDPQLPKNERMNVKPLSPYAVQKLSGEYYARLYHELYGMRTLSLRYFNVYGPRQDPGSPYSGVISIFMRKALSGQPALIYGDGNQSRDFVFVKDVVRANLLAADCGDTRGQIFNIGTATPVTIKRLWQMVCQMSGQDMDPEFAAPRPGEVFASVADIGAARSILGFVPEYAIEKGLAETMKWHRGAGRT